MTQSSRTFHDHDADATFARERDAVMSKSRRVLILNNPEKIWESLLYHVPVRVTIFIYTRRGAHILNRFPQESVGDQQVLVIQIVQEVAKGCME